MLYDRIEQDRKLQPILLMTHLVLGWPSFEENRKVIDQMYRFGGVELIELQIPFSEPMADGPVILKANHESLENGTTVEECFNFAKEMCKKYPQIQFLFMTYCNIMYAKGVESFVSHAKEVRIKGLIIPDLPPEEGKDYIQACRDHKVDSVFIYTPTHTEERLEQIAEVSRGIVYCVGRKGVTGQNTDFGTEMKELIRRYQHKTNLPLALGFGVKQKADLEFLTGTVDIAVIGSEVLRIQEKDGVEAVGTFLTNLRW